MDPYIQDANDDEQPLDLSVKSRVVNCESSEKKVHQESPMCLVKSCDCGSQRKRFPACTESSAEAPPTVFDSRYYSAFTTKGRLLGNNGRLQVNYSAEDNNRQSKSVSPYHRYSPPYSAYNVNDTSTDSYDKHSQPPTLRNQSTMAFTITNSEKPNTGKYDVRYLSQSACTQNSPGPSLLDLVNGSIESQIRTDSESMTTKRTAVDVKCIKREHVDFLPNHTLDESRCSPSGSKRQRIDDSRAPYSHYDSPHIKEQTQTEENIDVVAIDESEASGTRKDSTDMEIKRENSPIGKSNKQTEMKPVRKNSGSKVLDLDYMISKVLSDRKDIPFTAQKSHSIKRFVSNEGKAQLGLRLVDLIELQVEESLKA